MLFKRIRARRAARLAKTQQKLERSKDIFRVESTSGAQAVGAAITMTLSEDSAFSSSIATGALVELHEQEIKDNAIEIQKLQFSLETTRENHSMEMASKDEKIASLDLAVKRTMDELNAVILQIDLKEDELTQAKQDAADKDTELLNFKDEIDHLKQELQTVSTTLIQTQHSLFEKEQELLNLKQLLDAGKDFLGNLFGQK